MHNKIIKAAKTVLKKLLEPQTEDENLKRRGLVLNILLALSSVVFCLLNIIRLYDILTRPQDDGLHIMYSLAILIFFLFLLHLSRQGKIKLASWLFLITYSLPLFYSLWAWGADLPAAILLAVLIITLSGILISGDMVLISTVFIAAVMITLTYYQGAGLIAVDHTWQKQTRELGDAIANAVLLSIIATIAWLFVREIGRALKRAQDSETVLRQERDSLEIRVAERTEQLRQAEAEKINQLYRLAEFGRLSSGLFHDLINPLTAVSLNLEQVAGGGAQTVTDAKSHLSQAITATHRMEGLIAGIKKQLQRDGGHSRFSINEEIKQIIEVLSYKARREHVTVNFQATAEIFWWGDAVKFGQIIINLVANAIEACEDVPTEHKEISVRIAEDKQHVTISVQDYGTGINPDHINKIFAPFFSTKSSVGRGLGLGLASTKSIVEKDFGGVISVVSEPGAGSKFTVTLPKI